MLNNSWLKDLFQGAGRQLFMTAELLGCKRDVVRQDFTFFLLLFLPGYNLLRYVVIWVQHIFYPSLVQYMETSFSDLRPNNFLVYLLEVISEAVDFLVGL